MAFAPENEHRAGETRERARHGERKRNRPTHRDAGVPRLLAEIDIHSQRGQNLIQVFKTATRMEVAFWQQGLNAQ